MDQEQRRRISWLLRAWAALAGLSLFACWPGLTGSWVTDDWHMVGNYLYADWAELGAVFQRNAAYYLFSEGMTGPYRPITMLTLLATHLVAAEPAGHHAVSWLLHLATAALLFTALRAQLGRVGRPGRAVDAASLALASVFFLHPVAVEAYVWINGRSDLMAGFWLAALLVLLEREPPPERPWVDPLIVGLVAFLGVGSKLPFAFAALACWGAWAWGRPSAQTRFRGAAIAAALAIHAILRSHFAPFDGRVGTTEGVLSEPQLWLDIPRLWGEGAWALASFRAEVMQSLSWLLHGGWPLQAALGLAALVVASAALARRGEAAGLLYLAGAVITLTPVIVVSRVFWFGFDRYLYMPSMLVVLAMAPHVLPLASSSRRPLRALAVTAIAVTLTFCVARTRHASAAYAGQSAHDAAVERDHPDDPTVDLYMARTSARRGDEDDARRRLREMAPPPWPRTIAVATYELALSVEDRGRMLDAISVWSESSTSANCAATRERLIRWKSRDSLPEIEGVLAEAIDGLSCDP